MALVKPIRTEKTPLRLKLTWREVAGPPQSGRARSVNRPCFLTPASFPLIRSASGSGLRERTLTAPLGFIGFDLLPPTTSR